MVDYSKGKIYQIVSPDGKMVYVGSTVKDRLCQRMSKHSSSYKNSRTDNVTAYQIFDKYGFQNCSIELIEMYPCQSKDELNSREGFWIRKKMESGCVNKVIPGRTLKQYYEDNRDNIRKRDRENYQKHKDNILKRQRDYYEENRDNIIKRKLDYYKDNRDKILKRQCEFYTKNQDKINARRRRLDSCDCGSNYTHDHRCRHMRTLKHQQWEEDQFQEFDKWYRNEYLKTL